jgi:hypothetical protein
VLTQRVALRPLAEQLPGLFAVQPAPPTSVYENIVPLTVKEGLKPGKEERPEESLLSLGDFKMRG